MSEDAQRKLEEDIRYVDEELRKLDEDKKRQEEQKLAEEDDLDTKSKILSRPMIEVARVGAAPKPQPLSETPTPQFFGVGVAGVSTVKQKAPRLHADTIGGIVKEMLAMRWDKQLAQKQARGEGTPQDIYRRLFLSRWAQQAREEELFDDLRDIEIRSKSRIERINQLNIIKLNDELTGTLKTELELLQQEEARRYYLRQRLIPKIPVEDLKKIDWLEPIGDGAFGVIPYTYLTQWDLITPEMRRAQYWYYDNLMLRWQMVILGHWAPKDAKLPSVTLGKPTALEKLFDGEKKAEEYANKKFSEQVKKFLANIKQIADEMKALDKLSEAEEKKIRQQYSAYIKKVESAK